VKWLGGLARVRIESRSRFITGLTTVPRHPRPVLVVSETWYSSSVRGLGCLLRLRAELDDPELHFAIGLHIAFTFPEAEAMARIRRFALRKIAENEIAECFGDLDAVVRSDLATSLLRQWLSCEGHAGIVTATHQWWFRLIEKGDHVDVGFGRGVGNLGKILMEEWGLEKAEIAQILHRLNLCQSVLHQTGDGRTIRLGIEPRERAVWCEEQSGEDE
jgi:hypothetical protein